MINKPKILLSAPMRIKLIEYLKYNLYRITHKIDYPLKEFEKHVFSQYGEDGILEYIFENIGTTSKKFVEIGIEDGSECNTRNLIENHGWNGKMIEMTKQDVIDARKLFKKFPIEVINEKISKYNVNNYLDDDLDLLSIDIDGNDFWIWKAVKSRPRVIMIEYNSSFGKKPITIPYTADMRIERHPDWLYHSAGLNAFRILADERGYDLVYANGTNSIFIRKDINNIPKFDNFNHVPENTGRRRWGNPDKQFSLIKNRKFIDYKNVEYKK